MPDPSTVSTLQQVPLHRELGSSIESLGHISDAIYLAGQLNTGVAAYSAWRESYPQHGMAFREWLLDHSKLATEQAEDQQ